MKKERYMDYLKILHWRHMEGLASGGGRDAVREAEMTAERGKTCVQAACFFSRTGRWIDRGQFFAGRIR